jgi:hypothetical protein
MLHRFYTEQVVLLTLQNSIVVALVFRFLVTGLFRKYPYFFGFLLVASLQALVLSFISQNSPSYFYPWLVSQALLTCFGLLIVLELYTLILRDLAGIASASRRYIKICLGLAIAGSSVLLLLERKPQTLITTFTIMDRVLVTSLLIFVLMLTAFLVYYPVPINRNLVVYSIGYAVYYMFKGIGLLIININYTWGRQFSIVVVAAFALSLLFWLVGLSRQGEEKTLVIGHRWNRDDQEEILERLKSINARLLRTGRR